MNLSRYPKEICTSMRGGLRRSSRNILNKDALLIVPLFPSNSTIVPTPEAPEVFLLRKSLITKNIVKDTPPSFFLPKIGEGVPLVIPVPFLGVQMNFKGASFKIFISQKVPKFSIFSFFLERTFFFS